MPAYNDHWNGTPNHCIDIAGPDGNAFALMGHAKGLAKQIGLDHHKITGEMMQGDYNHLLDTFEKYFGNVVELINRAPKR